MCVGSIFDTLWLSKVTMVSWGVTVSQRAGLALVVRQVPKSRSLIPPPLPLTPLLLMEKNPLHMP